MRERERAKKKTPNIININLLNIRSEQFYLEIYRKIVEEPNNTAEEKKAKTQC
jgi:hypothetical protein